MAIVVRGFVLCSEHHPARQIAAPLLHPPLQRS
jgi:hypothetical protein